MDTRHSTSLTSMSSPTKRPGRRWRTPAHARRSSDQPTQDQVGADLATLALLTAPCAHAAARFQCLHKIDTLSALGFCARDRRSRALRYRPDQLTPPVRGSCRQSTPPGNSTGSGRSPRPARPTRAVVEPPSTTGAPSRGTALERRQRGHAPEVVDICWKAQRRLDAR